MNPVLKQLLETGQIKAPSGEMMPLHSHIPRDEGECLQQIIRQIKPRISVEIGCAFGISSLYICEALAEVGVVGEMLGENLQRHGGVQALVPARVDNGHAAASELVLEAELAQPKPRCPK